MTVQTEDRPAIRMDISDLFQLRRNPLRILETRQKDQAVYFTNFSVLFIDRTDLTCYDKAGNNFSRNTLILDPVFVFQYIKPVLRRLQFLLQLFPPCRMSEITGSYNMYSFLPRPQIQVLRCAVFARRPGISGMNMQISYVHNDTSFA